jgi:signal transduction histidine kinase
MSDNFRKHVD